MAIRFFTAEGAAEPPRKPGLLVLARQVAKSEKLRGEVNVIFALDENVRELNKRFRGLDKVTDVLSFPGEEDFPGEVYIAMGQAARQAPRYSQTLYQELKRLLVHGILHLAGHDHMEAGERKRMRAAEDGYLNLK